MKINSGILNDKLLKKAGVLSISILLVITVIIPSVSSHLSSNSTENLVNTINFKKVINSPIDSISPPVLNGLLEDVYLSHSKRIYYVNQNYEKANGNLYVIDNTSIDSEYIWIAWVINPFYVDNTYGNGTVPQYLNPNGNPCGHNFEDLNKSDLQEIKLYDTNDSLILYASMDLIHFVYNEPSGYGIPQWGDGESRIYYGNPNLVKYSTSLTNNVNYYYDTPPYNVLTDSPTFGDQNYTLYPGYELWEHRIIYELRVNRTLFGEYNIDIFSTEFPDLHASPNKIGPHNIPLNPIYSSIGDYVWEDENKDGIQDADENGMADVTVKLHYYYQESNTTVLETTTTDSSGYYKFNSLAPGEYYIEFILPTGYQFTSRDQTDDENDSDANVMTGKTINIDISPGENDMTWDAGMYLLEFYLTIDIEGNGVVVIDPDQEIYKYGTVVKLTAIPDEEWSFSYWSGDLNGSNNPENITMNENKTISAHFSINEYTLTINIIGEGTVIKNPDQATYPFGTTVELTAIPDEKWIFEYWSGDLSGDENPQDILIDGDKVVDAHFKEDITSPEISITKPEKGIYIFDKKLANFVFPIIFNEITIEADASDEISGLDKVEFYIDGELRETDDEPPYSYHWNDSLKRFHTIEAIAYDNVGNTASDSIKALKVGVQYPFIWIGILIFVILISRLIMS